MKFEPIEAASLTDLFIEQMEEKIFTGELKAGDRLPPEREIAKSMQISQTIVNNGFAVLAGRGLLKVVPRKGTFVADYLNEGGLEALSAVVHYTSRHLEIPFTIDLYCFRLGCESAFFQTACLNMTEQDRAEMTRYYQKSRESTDDCETFAENWYQFIRFMSIVSGNKIYRMIINGHKQMYLAVFRALHQHAPMPEYFALTDKVFRSLLDADPTSLHEYIREYQEYEIGILEANGFFKHKE